MKNNKEITEIITGKKAKSGRAYALKLMSSEDYRNSKKETKKNFRIWQNERKIEEKKLEPQVRAKLGKI